jgi:hypothetical protein
MGVTTKTITAAEQQSEQEVKRLFSFMNMAAWIALGVGLIMCLWNVSHFNDENLSLMLGIGLMVGSVFVYTIGTAIHLVHKRKFE